MNVLHIRTYTSFQMRRKFLIIFITLLISCSVSAQQSSYDSIAQLKDTSEKITQLNKLSGEYISSNKPDSAIILAAEALKLAQITHNVKGEARAWYLIGDVYTSKGRYKKALSHFLRSLRLKREVKDKNLTVKLYYKLANTLLRLKLYPQALKCYYKMTGAYEAGKNKSNYLYVEQRSSLTKDSTTQLTDSSEQVDNSARIIEGEDDMLLEDTSEQSIKTFIADSVETPEQTVESPPIENGDITDCFNDGKKAIAYGIMVHVKQPKAGVRTVMSKLNNVGHTFVTLIKFNADSTTLSRSFGFYPKKDNLLSATPLIPTTTSVFKDDAKHEWDEVVGKLISKRKFDKIIQMVKQYKCKKYNLNSNNCTDFGLDIAAIAGIKIKDTHSTWFLGKGNNPGNAGQSILEGKLSDEEKSELFIFNSIKK